MTKEQALKLFESLIVQVMASGGFKDLKTLDDYREALRVLQDAEKK